MAQDNSRKSITLPADLWDEVASYMRALSIPSYAEAIRRLLQDRLAQERKKVDGL
jgi:metal-responsive CopG/Arc/MetJ family transcriptional regulator